VEVKVEVRVEVKVVQLKVVNLLDSTLHFLYPHQWIAAFLLFKCHLSIILKETQCWKINLTFIIFILPLSKKCLNSFKRKLGKSIREIDSFQPNLFDSSASLPLQSFTQNGYNAKLDSLEKDKNSLGKLIIKLNRTLDRLNCQTKDYLTKAKSCQEYSTQLEIHLRSKNQVKAHNLYLKFLAMQARKKAEKVKEDTAMEAVANRMKSMNLGKKRWIKSS